MTDGAESWRRATLAIRLLAACPAGLGGAVIRMRAGPARDAVLAALASLRARKIHPTIGTEQLLGGLDLSGTLSSGHLIETKGLFRTESTLCLTMAERAPAQLSALIAQHMDATPGFTLIALDEGAEDDERCTPALADRLAFHIAPEGRMPAGWSPAPTGTEPATAQVTVRPDDIEALTTLAAQCGIDSLRAPLLALQTARVHATLAGRDTLAQEDLAAAAELVFAHRATRIPEPDMPEESDTPPPPDEPEDSASDNEESALPDGDIMVDAVRAALPEGLLAGLVPAGTARGSGSGAGTKRKGNRKGRPLPSRPGKLDGQHRIDLVATLRAAAPWQPLRQCAVASRTPDASAFVPAGTLPAHNAVPAGTGLQIRPSDIRVKRYEEQSDRLLIFAVDASGSAALARLNEAKGAVETLLAQAYAARDHVALIAFRGEGAELLLPPTRSLVQTKRRLASLPGGGGTPLAAGLSEAMQLARQSRARGLTPTVILLTDGRSNIALDGTPNRDRATRDAEAMARALRTEGIAALVIDMSPRPQPPLRALSATLDAPYIALPRADARRLSGAVSAALEG